MFKNLRLLFFLEVKSKQCKHKISVLKIALNVKLLLKFVFKKKELRV